MATKKIQKAFYLSSEHVKKFIDSRLEDITLNSSASSSYIIENFLLDGMLPKNAEARSMIFNNLYPDNSSGVKETLVSLFASNEDPNWKAKHANLFPIIEFCIKYGSDSAACRGDEHPIYHFLSQFESVVNRIDSCTSFCIESYDRYMYKDLLNRAQSLLARANEDPKTIIYKEHFDLVRDCWKMLDDWAITYRYLKDLTEMDTFLESASSRNELCSVINDISKTW